MRKLFILAIAAILMLGTAWAAEGQQAQLTITVTLSEEMQAMLGAMGGSGDSSDGVPAEDIEPMVLSQRMFWSDAGLRMEIMTDAGIEATVIYDYVNNLMYQYNAVDQVATKMKLDQTAGLGEMGMLGSDPMDMFLNWENILQGMQDQPHMVMNEFPEKTIGGYVCKGLGFSMDIEAMMAERASDSEGNGMGMGMAMGMLSAMGDIGGEIWYSDELGYPILYDYTSMGSRISLALSDLKAWTVDDAMFAVPAGYEIEDLEMPDFGDMEMPEVNQ